MGWEDRPYYRDRGGPPSNPFTWLATGSVPLFTALNIRVRAHASLVVYSALVLLLGFGYQGFTLGDRVTMVTVLFAIVLLHEYGHCLTARWVGGEANDILMHPLGGLAFARPPHRPLPTFLTVAGGPAVNVLICLVCGAILWWKVGWVPTSPYRFVPPVDEISDEWWSVLRYVFWIYQVSFQLFMFNLLPIFPLDGGQMLQAILWPKFGYFKSMIFACTTGMVGAVVGAMVAIATGNLGLSILAILGFMTCYQLRLQTLAAGPAMLDDQGDYSAAYINLDRQKKTKGPGFFARKKAERDTQTEAEEQQRVDEILAKVSASGMNSLSRSERNYLKKATENQRKRDAAKVAARKRGL